MHDALTVGIPVFVILFGILFNQRGLDKLEARMNVLESRIDGRMHGIEARLDRMQADLSMFYRILGEHGADIDHLKKNRPA
jgi:hypothetical protein